MELFKLIRSFFISFLSTTLIFGNVAYSSALTDSDTSFHLVTQQVVDLFSQFQSYKELENYYFLTRPRAEHESIREMFSHVDLNARLPQFQKQGNLIVITGLDRPIEIDISSASKGFYYIDGTKFTVDPKAPLKMHTEILMRRLEEKKASHKKYSLLSLFMPFAYAGKISGLRKGLNATSRAAKAAKEEEATAKLAEEAAKASAKSGSETWNPYRTLIVGGITIEMAKAIVNGGIDLVKGGLFTGLLQWSCGLTYKQHVDNVGNKIPPTQDEINKATVCKQFLKDQAEGIDKDKAQKEKTAKDNPKASAPAVVASLQNDEVKGLDVYSGLKVCPYENKENKYRSSISIITWDPKKQANVLETQIVEAEFDGNKLKQIQCFSLTKNMKPGPAVATYIVKDGGLDVIKIPNPDYDSQKTDPGSPDLEIKTSADLSKDPKIDGYKKRHNQIFGKIMLSITSCADELKDIEGKKAAQHAIKKTPTADAISPSTHPAGGTK